MKFVLDLLNIDQLKIRFHSDGFSIDGLGSVRLSYILENLKWIGHCLNTLEKKMSTTVFLSTVCFLSKSAQAYSCHEFISSNYLTTYLNYTQGDSFLSVKYTPQYYTLDVVNNVCGFILGNQQLGDYQQLDCLCFDTYKIGQTETNTPLLDSGYKVILFGQNINDTMRDCMREFLGTDCSGLSAQYVMWIVGGTWMTLCIGGCLCYSIDKYRRRNQNEIPMLADIKRVNSVLDERSISINFVSPLRGVSTYSQRFREGEEKIASLRHPLLRKKEISEKIDKPSSLYTMPTVVKIPEKEKKCIAIPSIRPLPTPITQSGLQSNLFSDKKDVAVVINQELKNSQSMLGFQEFKEQKRKDETQHPNIYGSSRSKAISDALTPSGITDAFRIAEILTTLTDKNQKYLSDTECKKVTSILSTLDKVFKDVSTLNELHGNDSIALEEMEVIDKDKVLKTYYDTLRLNLYQLFMSAIVICSGNVKVDSGLSALATKGLGMAITQGAIQIGVTTVKQIPVASILGAAIEAIANFGTERRIKIRLWKVAQIVQISTPELLAKELARKITFGRQEIIRVPSQSRGGISKFVKLKHNILAVKRFVQEKLAGQQLTPVQHLAIDTAIDLMTFVFNGEFKGLTTRQAVVDKALKLLEIKYNPAIPIMTQYSSGTPTETKREMGVISLPLQVFPSIQTNDVTQDDNDSIKIMQRIEKLEYGFEEDHSKIKEIADKLKEPECSIEIGDCDQVQILGTSQGAPSTRQNISQSLSDDVIEYIQGLSAFVGYEHKSTKKPLSSAVRIGLFGNEKQLKPEGWELVHAAHKGEWIKITNNLSKVDEVDSKVYKVILFLAAEAEQSKLVIKILEKSKLSSNTKNPENNTPLLHVAIQRGDMRLLKSLRTRKSFDETVRDNQNRTPREAAQEAGYESIAATFI